MLKLAQRHRDNLQTLADYLDTVPLESFNMGHYRSSCGTVACAAGHSPDAGIGVAPPRGASPRKWDAYLKQHFGVSYRSGSTPRYRLLVWCFGDCWCEVDNTPRGAGARIRYYLDHGLPSREATDDMLDGAIPLPY